jgi:hypothetical protein
MLRFTVAFALRHARNLVRGLKQGLTEDERYRVADDVVTANQLGCGRVITRRRYRPRSCRGPRCGRGSKTSPQQIR